MTSEESTRQSRELALNGWARKVLAESNISVEEDFRLESASDDASFRRYFRGVTGQASFIFVDAPPAQEDSRPFVHIAGLLREAGLNAPVVHRQDLEQGFMMLTDFGDRLYLHALAEGDERIDTLYHDAVESIVRMQSMVRSHDLPIYGKTLLRNEVNLFTEWLIPRQLKLDTTAAEQRQIETVFDLMVDSALAQPAAFVHRDYHCRNLMVLDEGNPGIIDFQDAVIGPVTYDLVSLLKDCYHRFPQPMVSRWVETFRLRVMDERIITPVSADAFVRWFDLMGMQRHIKVAGIFSRLNLRDSKPRYLADIPLVVGYITEVCGRYDELGEFGRWLERRVVPQLALLDGH